MKKYQATKDHPYLKEGVVIEEGVSDLFFIHTREDGAFEVVAHPKQYHDWYEPVRWKPASLENYFFIVSDGTVFREVWRTRPIDATRHQIGNCYKTKEEAEAARERVLKAYKGEV